MQGGKYSGEREAKHKGTGKKRARATTERYIEEYSATREECDKQAYVENGDDSVVLIISSSASSERKKIL